MKNTVPCKNCEGGTMERKKKYVLGAGGAILRVFLMVPGVILILIGGIAILGGILTAGSTGREEAIEMLAGGIAGGMAIGFLVGGPFLVVLGLLIGIRKWKLICNQCGTAINAA